MSQSSTSHPVSPSDILRASQAPSGAAGEGAGSVPQTAGHPTDAPAHPPREAASRPSSKAPRSASPPREVKAQPARPDAGRADAASAASGPPPLPSSATRSASAAAGTKPSTARPGGRPGGPQRKAVLPELVVHDEELPTSALRSWLLMLSSWMCSVIVHAAAVIVLALITFTVAEQLPEPELLVVNEKRDPVDMTVVVDRSNVASTELAVNSNPVDVFQQGDNAALQVDQQPTIPDELRDDRTGPTISPGPLADLGGDVGQKLIMNVPDLAPGDPQSVVDSLDEAMDRITQEILLMLQNGKVLVVWLFDESESMRDEQQEIRDKVERVYRELGLLGATQGDALLTAVASYGRELHIHSRTPTHDVEQIRRYIDMVPLDESGEEQQCFAVTTTIDFFSKFARQGRRQLALIMVTDESGDPKSNFLGVEQAIQTARDNRCRIYVLGREAVFGYPHAYMRWTDPKTNITYWLQIDRGPETPFVEALQTQGLWRRHDAHPSGFGPYEQARMARETGGVFFMLPSPEVQLVQRDDRKYELARLRPYMPSLESRQEYLRERDASKLRTKLWEVITLLNPLDEERAKYVVMRHTFPIQREQYVPAMQQEMRKAMEYLRYLEQQEQALAALRAERSREIYPRWQANFDLIQAQIVKYKVLVREYGARLELFVREPKQQSIKPPRPNLTATHWDVRYVRAEQPLTGDLVRSDIQRSKEMFRKIIEDHPGTPWAARAEIEMNGPYSVDIVQDWDDPRRNAPGTKLPKL
jgi:hypothetical protein